MADGRDAIEEQLNDSLWIADSVTGNGSGSYTFNSAEAKEYVTDNEDLLKEALEAFCTDAETITDHFLNGDWEYFDVTIRCYLLGQAIGEVLDEIDFDAIENDDDLTLADVITETGEAIKRGFNSLSENTETVTA